MTQQPRRKRGVILTPQGKQRLLAAIREFEQDQNFGEKYTIEELSSQTGLDPGTVTKVLNAEERADRRTIDRFFQTFNLELTEADYRKPPAAQNLDLQEEPIATRQTPKSKIQNRVDWSEAVDVSIFYGRAEELATLKQWIVDDCCRLVALLGLGGIGKTSLAAKLGEQIQDKFEVVVWRSLKDAPPLKDILTSLIQFVSNHQETEADLPESTNARIIRLLEYLRNERCLLVLDNAESILQEGQAGVYREGYEGYGELLKRVGEASHQSCLILTSREKPKELSALEGVFLPVRCWQMRGIEDIDGQEILRIKGLELSGAEEQGKELIHRCAGNPLALKLVATTIQELFDGDIAEFLKEETIAFDGIQTLLDQHFDRLSDLEKSIMYWLAIEREPVSAQRLQEDIFPPMPRRDLLNAMKALVERSLIESAQAKYTQQPVVMEYMTERLVIQILEALRTDRLDIFNSYSLVKASTKDYIRSTQNRLFLKPIVDKLVQNFQNKQDFETQLNSISEVIRRLYKKEVGYAGGNFLNLLCYLKTDLSKFNFSELAVWQAYLQGVDLRRVDFSNADLSSSIFNKTHTSVLSLSFSPDGRRLALGDNTGKICLVQVEDGQQLLTYRGHVDLVKAVAFSPNGQILASGSRDRTVKLWDALTGKCTKTLKGHTSWVNSISFSPDGRLLASGGGDQMIKLWNAFTGQFLKDLEGHTDWINSVSFSPDGRLLASGSGDRTIKLWDIKSNQCLKTLEAHTNIIKSVAFHPNGEILASGSDDQTVRLWNISTGECLNVLQGQTKYGHSVAFTPDGRTLASTSVDRNIQLSEVSTGQCLTILRGHTAWVPTIIFSPDGRTLASGSEDQTVKLWDMQTGQCLKTLQGYVDRIWSVAFNPNGSILASGSCDQKVKLWNIATGECIKVLQGHTDWVRSITFHPNNQLLASGSNDQTVRLWDVSTGQCINVLQGHTDWVRSVAFNLNGQLLASGSNDQTVRLWDVSTGQCINVLQGHLETIRSIAFHSNNQFLVSGSSDQTVKLWDVRTGQCLETFQGHRGWVRSVALAPNGRILASGGSDYMIKLWDINTGQCLYTLQGHTDWINSINFSYDGQLLVSCSSDKTVRIWDIVTGDCLKTIQGYIDSLFSVAFSPDGKSFVSGGHDGVIRITDARSGEFLKDMKAPRPYEGMNITGATGLTDAQKSSLIALGAIDNG